MHCSGVYEGMIGYVFGVCMVCVWCVCGQICVFGVWVYVCGYVWYMICGVMCVWVVWCLECGWCVCDVWARRCECSVSVVFWSVCEMCV